MVYITDAVTECDSTLSKLCAGYKANSTPQNLLAIQHKVLSLKSTKHIEKDCGIIGFSYEYRKKDYSDVISSLNSLSVPRGLFKNIFKDKIAESKLKYQLLANVGTDRFAEKSEELYGYPSKKLIDKAYAILDLKPEPSDEEYGIIDAKKKLRKELSDMNIPWKIKSKKLLNYAHIIPSKETIYLSSNHKYSQRTIKRLAVHEIGTHGVRYMNAKKQPLKIFKNFPNYISTEEGLAAFNEEINGFLNNETLRRYAGRVVAIDYAQNNSLLQTYVFLRKFFDDKVAFNTALRVKRGLANSESLGAFTKDHVYLKGFFEIKKYLLKNPLKHLYYGKISLEHIDVIKKVEEELAPISFYPPLARTFDQKKSLLD